MSTPPATILVVDDEASVAFAIRRALDVGGLTVVTAGSVAEARAVARASPPDVAILDYNLPDGTGLDVLRALQADDPTLPVVMLTGEGSIDLAVRAIKEGADQFLIKPPELPALKLMVERLLAQRQARRAAQARHTRDARLRVDPFVGDSPAILALRQEARRVAQSHAPVLLTGATGTGKGVLAAWLHAHSVRASEPFVDINCAGLSRELVESELFGHERGAFTGAVAARAGLLELAHKGTLFLDEVGDMSLDIQPRLLKVVEDKRFRRVGGAQERAVEVRLIAATHRDLLAWVAQGRFREDLYYRLNTLTLKVPTLRERGDDVLVLAARLVELMCAETGRPTPDFDDGARAVLRAHPWPGNVRELRNVLERVLLATRADVVDAAAVRAALPPLPTLGPQASADVARQSLKQAEKRHIELVLRAHGGDVMAAARTLGLSRSAMYEKLRKHGLSTPRAAASS